VQVVEIAIPIVAGVVMVAFHKPYAKAVEAFQRVIGFKYDDSDRRAARFAIILVGCLFVLFGLAELVAELR
jgi:hypothetical protein